jgi:hypothetical protein
MIKPPRALFRAMGFRGLRGRLANPSPALRFESIHYRIAFSLALLAFTPPGVAAESKDPTLRSANAASHAAMPTGSRGLRPARGGQSSFTDSTTKAVNLDSQLKQLENKTSKPTHGKQVEAKSSNRTEPTPALSSRSAKIDFRLPPQRKSGTNNQQGQGSGSRRSGPGRRVTEKSP